MPRSSSIVLPDCPHHIVQRGHNRQVVFVGDEDYRHYLENLKEWKTREWVKGAIPGGEWKMIREAVKMGRPTGSNRFAEEISEKIGRRVELRRQGRPRKDKK